MIKEIKTIVLENSKEVYRVTTPSERWYMKERTNFLTGLPELVGAPSVTWVTSFYPKGKQYNQWLSEHGIDEAETIMKEAGNAGDKVHQATEDLEKKGMIHCESLYLNKGIGLMEELTSDELMAIQSYQQWRDETKWVMVANEMTVFVTKDVSAIIDNGVGGTIDRIFIESLSDNKRQVWIVDLKTSKSIYPGHEIQISAYGMADIDYVNLGITKEEWQNRKLGILQLNYVYNKLKKYKFTEIPNQFDLFLSIARIWKKENPNEKVKQRDFPLSIRSEWIMSRLQPAENAPIIKASSKLKTVKKS